MLSVRDPQDFIFCVRALSGDAFAAGCTQPAGVAFPFASLPVHCTAVGAAPCASSDGSPSLPLQVDNVLPAFIHIWYGVQFTGVQPAGIVLAVSVQLAACAFLIPNIGLKSPTKMTSIRIYGRNFFIFIYFDLITDPTFRPRLGID